MNMDAGNIIAEIEDIITATPDIHYRWVAGEHLEWLDGVMG
jgi:hypothetical protein